MAEIKTSIKSLEDTVGAYRDQLQWQMHVTGAGRALFVVENHESLTREFEWIHRDERRIDQLAVHADLFLAELDVRREALVPVTVEGRIYTMTCECHSDEGVRYVGMTTGALTRRLAEHRRDAERDDPLKPVHEWMREHGVENIRINELEEITRPGMLRVRETRWIAHLRGQGCDLLNVVGAWTVSADGVWLRSDGTGR